MKKTDDYLTAKKFGAGPTAVVLLQKNGWTYGGLANQVWSVAGDENRTDVNQLYLQPFLAYNWSSGAGIGLNAEITQNWHAETTVAWINANLSAVTSFGNQKAQFSIGPKLNVAAPNGRKADIGIRAVFVLLFPK